MTSSSQRAPGREHIPDFPSGWIILRYVQFLFCLLSIAFVGYSSAAILLLGPFVALITSTLSFIVSIWLIVAHWFVPKIYNYWAVLTLDIFLWLCWCVSSFFCIMYLMHVLYNRYVSCERPMDGVDPQSRWMGFSKQDCIDGQVSVGFLALLTTITGLSSCQM
ncbi:hypothetical protein CDD83_5776 [Cordyceps sp. RAO-2017]|nr:hypothetical protein CDD83_5776 [Cordyceps sp. RAO-2017]